MRLEVHIQMLSASKRRLLCLFVFFVRKDKAEGFVIDFTSLLLPIAIKLRIENLRSEIVLHASYFMLQANDTPLGLTDQAS